MSIPRFTYRLIFKAVLMLACGSTYADIAPSKPVFTAEQQLLLEKYTHGIDNKVGDVSNQLAQLQQKIDSGNAAQAIKDSAKQVALDSQLALFKLENETKNTSLTLAKDNLELSQHSVDLWLGLLGLLLAGATIIVWRVRGSIKQDWDEQKNQIAAEHDKAIQNIDSSREQLTSEVKDCLVEARDRIKELREELNHARSINGDIIKIHDKAEATLLSGKENTPEQIDEAIRKNKAKAEESAQSALVAKAMELQKDKDWEAASKRWLALTDLAPSNANYWFNYGYALYKSTKSENCVRLLNLICDIYRQVTVLTPSNAEAFVNWGVALQSIGRISGDEKVRYYSAALDKYEKASVIQPDISTVWSNWGILLKLKAQILSGVEQQFCFKESVEKLNKASMLEPDNPNIDYSLGSALSMWGSTLEGDARESMLVEAEKVLLKALELEPSKTYNLACLKALQGKTNESRKFIEVAKESGNLPDLNHLGSDLDLDNLRDLPWFQELLAEISESPEQTEAA